MRSRTPAQHAILAVALRHLDYAISELTEAGEALASMRVAAVRSTLDNK